MWEENDVAAEHTALTILDSAHTRGYNLTAVVYESFGWCFAGFTAISHPGSLLYVVSSSFRRLQT